MLDAGQGEVSFGADHHGPELVIVAKMDATKHAIRTMFDRLRLKVRKRVGIVKIGDEISTTVSSISAEIYTAPLTSRSKRRCLDERLNWQISSPHRVTPRPNDDRHPTDAGAC